MKSNILEKTINDSKPFIEKHNTSMKEIDDLDNQILTLIDMRSSLISKELENVKNIFSFKNTFGVNARDIWDEYSTKSFDSDIVKTAISKIRELFFDDEKETHQKYNCVDIDLETYIISFTFSNGKREFSINIPYRMSYDNDTILDREYFGNTFYISYKTSECCIGSSPGTYNINDIREDVDMFINEKINTRDYLGRGNGFLEEVNSVMNERLNRFTNQIF